MTPYSRFLFILTITLALNLKEDLSRPPYYAHVDSNSSSSRSSIATQQEIGSALYTQEEFFETMIKAPRPYAEARQKLAELITKYPKDAKLYLKAAQLDQQLKLFDKAKEEMEQYVSLNQDSLEALGRLAEFYHNRALYSDEVKTLQKIAIASPLEEREEIYRQAIQIIKEHKLTDFNADDFYHQLIKADPENFQFFQNYIDELLQQKRYADALKEIETYQSHADQAQEFEASQLAYFLKTQAAIYEAQNDRKKAEAIYESRFDPTWPYQIRADYYQLLKRHGKYRSYRRELMQKFKGERLFSLYLNENNLSQALRTLEELEKRRDVKAQNSKASAASAWTQKELETMAGMYITVGNYDAASKYLYTLYLSGTFQKDKEDKGEKRSDRSDREEVLYRLFAVFMGAENQRIRWNQGDLSFYKDIVSIDQSPGFLNGILSIILSGEKKQKEFQIQELKAAKYFNGAMAYKIFSDFKAQYAASKHLPQMYLDLMNFTFDLAEYPLAVELGQQFLKAFPKARNYEEISLRIFEAYALLKDRQNEREVLQDLLDRLGRNRQKNKRLIPLFSSYKFSGYESEKISYSSVLERMVASFAADDKRIETLGFFWNEVKKYPDEEGLYERMLKWLEGTNLFDEQLKVYSAAIGRFKEKNWHHRLARWYIRLKRTEDFRNYSKEILSAIDEENVKEYLDEFMRQSLEPNQSDYDSKFAIGLYQLAHERFSNNLALVEGLLRYYKHQDINRWEKLAATYYFASPEIREQFLTRLSQKGELRLIYQKARQKTEKSEATEATEATLPYQHFAADAAIWLSHYDQAVESYRKLVSLYPGEISYATRLASLLRSLGSYEEAEEAAAILADLSKLYPLNHEYLTQAGEIYAQIGDFKRARQSWDKILEVEGRKGEAYLEVASIYWDYYQYDDAVRVIQNLRQIEDDDALYAYKLGAVYEAKDDIEKAVMEYVAELADRGTGKDKAIQRLKQLKQREKGEKGENLPRLIEAAYQKRVAAKPQDFSILLGYAEYLQQSGERKEALSLLHQGMESRDNPDFIWSALDLFRRQGADEYEEQAILRLISLAKDEREAINYRLQLVSFYERLKQTTKAASRAAKMVEDYPTNLGVIQAVERAYWRIGKGHKSVELLKKVAEKARGKYRRQFRMELAKRLVEAKKMKEAETLLRAEYESNPIDAESFSLLAKILEADGKKSEKLIELYQRSIGALQKASPDKLDKEEKTWRLAELRRRLIASLQKTGRHREAIDQYIEIINRQPEDISQIEAAIRYADKYQQSQYLAQYYETLAKKAFKDFRWNLVLARIYNYGGGQKAEMEQYKLALVNEPQRLDIRLSLAELLLRLGRYDEAVIEFRKIYELNGFRHSWLIKIADLQIRQKRPNEAIATLRQDLKRRKRISAGTLFDFAKFLKGRKLIQEALDFYEEGFSLVKRDVYKEFFDAENLREYAESLVIQRSPLRAYQKLIAFRNALFQEANKPDNLEAERVRTLLSVIDGILRDSFGRIVIEYSNAAEIDEFKLAIGNGIKSKSDYSMKTQEELRYHLSLAQAANLADLEAEILTKLKDNAYKVRGDINDRRFYNELNKLLDFYDKRTAFAKSAELLLKESRRAKFYDYDFIAEIAKRYQKAGDLQKELETLRSFYSRQVGELTENEHPLIARYLTLLYEQKNKDEIERLARNYNSYQLQLVNFLIAHREKELAIVALRNVGLSEAWTASGKAQIGLYFQDASKEVEGSFITALNLKPIGELLQIQRQPQRQPQFLMGDDRYLTARNYGMWLRLDDKNDKSYEESRKYIIAKIERFPIDPKAQLELASYYLDDVKAIRAKHTSSPLSLHLAMEHVNLAEELAASSNELLAVKGKIYLAKGDKKRAIETWNRIITRADAGEAEYLTHFKLLAENKLADKAVFALKRFLTQKSRTEDLKALKPFLDRVSNIFDFDEEIKEKTDSSLPRLRRDLSRILLDIAKENKEEINVLSIPSIVLESEIAPLEEREAFYQILISRLRDKIRRGNLYYYDEYGRYQPLKPSIDKWQRRFIDYLMVQKRYEQAQHELKEMGFKDSDVLVVPEFPEWVEFAIATLELRTGQIQSAVDRLRKYERIDQVKAYTLLMNEGHEKEALNLLADYYRRQIDLAGFVDISGDSSKATIAPYFLGVAEVEFKRHRADEALKWLAKLVRSSESESEEENSRWILEAGILAAKYGAKAEAFSWGQKAAENLQSQASELLEFADIAAYSGNFKAALNTLLKLTETRQTPNSIKAAAVELLSEMAVQNKLDEPNQIVKLATSLQSQIPVLSEIKGGILELQSAHSDLAKSHFLRALYLDPTQQLAKELSFVMETPRAYLIRLYVQEGKDWAALAIAQTDESDLKPSTSATSTEDAISISIKVDKSPSPKSPGSESEYRTLSERNSEQRTKSKRQLFSLLSDSAAKAGEFALAIEYAKAERQLLTSPEEVKQADMRIVKLTDKQKERSASISSALRLSKRFVSEEGN